VGNVIAFQPKRLEKEYNGTGGEYPKVIFTEMKGTCTHMFNEFILVGENSEGEIQAVNCEFDKICDTIEFLYEQAKETVDRGFNVLDMQRFDKMLRHINGPSISHKWRK
jgi:hypothetical protein